MNFKESLSRIKERSECLRAYKGFKRIAPLMCLVLCTSFVSSVGFRECYPADAYMFNELAGVGLPHNSEIDSKLDVQQLATDLREVRLSETPIVDYNLVGSVDDSEIPLGDKDGEKHASADDVEKEVDQTEEVAPTEEALPDEELISEETFSQETEQESTEPVVFYEYNTPFTAVNETVYTHGIINIRYGPSNKYDVMMRIPSGATVTRIGRGAYGWDKIDYNGTIAYAWSKFLHWDCP